MNVLTPVEVKFSVPRDFSGPHTEINLNHEYCPIALETNLTHMGRGGGVEVT